MKTIRPDRAGTLKLCILGSAFSFPIKMMSRLRIAEYATKSCFFTPNGEHEFDGMQDDQLYQNYVEPLRGLISISVTTEAPAKFAYEVYNRKEDDVVEDDGKRRVWIMNMGTARAYCTEPEQYDSRRNNCIGFREHSFTNRLFRVDDSHYSGARQNKKHLTAQVKLLDGLYAKSITHPEDPTDDDYIMLMINMTHKLMGKTVTNVVRLRQLVSFGRDLLQRMREIPDIDLDQTLALSRTFFVGTGANYTRISPELQFPTTAIAPTEEPFTPSPPVLSPPSPQVAATPFLSPPALSPPSPLASSPPQQQPPPSSSSLAPQANVPPLVNVDIVEDYEESNLGSQPLMDERQQQAVAEAHRRQEEQQHHIPILSSPPSGSGGGMAEEEMRMAEKERGEGGGDDGGGAFETGGEAEEEQEEEEEALERQAPYMPAELAEMLQLGERERRSELGMRQIGDIDTTVRRTSAAVRGRGGRRLGSMRGTETIPRQDLYQQCMRGSPAANDPGCYGGDIQLQLCTDADPNECDFRKVKVPNNYANVTNEAVVEKHLYYFRSPSFKKLQFHLGRCRVRFGSAANMITRYSKLALTRHFLPFKGFHSSFDTDDNGDVVNEVNVVNYNDALATNFSLVKPHVCTFKDNLSMFSVETLNLVSFPTFALFKRMINTLTMMYTGSFTEVGMLGGVPNVQVQFSAYENKVSEPSTPVPIQAMCTRLPFVGYQLQSNHIVMTNVFMKQVVADNSLLIPANTSTPQSMFYQSPMEVLTFGLGTAKSAKYYVNSPFFTKDHTRADAVIPSPQYINDKLLRTYDRQYGRGVGFLSVSIDNLKMAALVYHVRMFVTLCRMLSRGYTTVNDVPAVEAAQEMQQMRMFFLTDFEHRMLCLAFAAMSQFRDDHFAHDTESKINFSLEMSASKQKYITFMTELLLQYHYYIASISKRNRTTMMSVSTNTPDQNVEVFRKRMQELLQAHVFANSFQPHTLVRIPDRQEMETMLENIQTHQQTVKTLSTEAAMGDLFHRQQTPIPSTERQASETDATQVAFYASTRLANTAKTILKSTLNVALYAAMQTEAMKDVMCNLITLTLSAYEDARRVHNVLVDLYKQHKITEELIDVIKTDIVNERTASLTDVKRDVNAYAAFYTPVVKGLGDVFVEALGNESALL